MSPEKNALRWAEVALEVDGARRLIDAGCMASENLPDWQRQAMSELLHEVASRLESIAEDIEYDRKVA